MALDEQQSENATIDQNDEKRVITSQHEEEIYVDADTLAGFLRELANQVEQGDQLTISTENWELPFSFDRQQVEIEIDRGYDELEIEIEFDEAKQAGDISVE